MNIVIYILVAGLVLRTILDLVALSRNTLVTDALYTILYGCLGAAMLFNDPNSLFGYGAIIVAVGWAAHGGFLLRKQKLAQN